MQPCPYCKRTERIPLTTNLSVCKICDALIKDDFVYSGYSIEENERIPSYLNELNSMFGQHLLYFMCENEIVFTDRKILEIGCLNGSFLSQMSHWGMRVTGCDIHTLTTAFKVFPSIKAITGNYDIIAMIHTIEHLPSTELVVLANKVFDCLNKGGLFYSVTNVTFPIETALYDMKEPTHYAFPTRLSYQHLFPFLTMREFENRWDYSSTCIMQF